MDMEEEILAFGETAVWIECDLRVTAYGGPGVNKVIVPIGHINACAECLRSEKQLGNLYCRRWLSRLAQ